MADETIMDRARRGEFDMYEVPEDGPEVASWCPSPTPTVPPTQVHLFLPMHGAVFVIRFKSTRTLDALIAALQSHRDEVFGVRTTAHEGAVTRAAMLRGEAVEYVREVASATAAKDAELHAQGVCAARATTCPVCAHAGRS